MSDFIRETKEDDRLYEFWCPACEMHHHIDDKWTIDLVNNTLSPSVLWESMNHRKHWKTDENGDYIFGKDNKVIGAKKIKCHSFVKNGTIQYLNDCTHELAGTTSPMEPLK